MCETPEKRITKEVEKLNVMVQSEAVESVKELLASWKIGEAAELAVSHGEAMEALFHLGRNGDQETRLRALTAIVEALKLLPGLRKLILVKSYLPSLLEVCSDGDDRIAMKALEALEILIRGVPLEPPQFIEVVGQLKDLVKARRNEAVLLQIPPILEEIRVTSPSPIIYDTVSRLLKSRNLRLKAMGLRLLLNTASYTGSTSLLKEIFSSSRDMLMGDDVPLADFVLDMLLEISKFPLSGELIDDVATTLTAVKNLVLRRKELREKAKIVSELLEARLHEYYLKKPDEAKRKIHELLIREHFYEAIDLALAVGDTYVLGWLAETLEKMGKKSLEINERVLPGPRYPSVPLEKKAQRHLKPPALSQFRGGKRGSVNVSPSEPESGEGLDEAEKEELKRALETGEEKKLIELSERRPDVVFELTRKLEGGDKFDRMDALWALSMLAERLDAAKAFILKPAVEPLMRIAPAKNRWMRLRTAKTLATLASKAPYGDEIVGRFLEWYLSGNEDKAAPSLEFFSYYFHKTWDEKAASVALYLLPEYLEKERTRFDALLVLEALVESAPVEKASLFGSFVEKLKEIKKNASPDEQKLAIRVLEEIASKSKALVSR